VHPQSIVHSFVEFRDGSTIAQLSPPSMKLPIQYALTWPERTDGCSPTIAWDAMRSLDFEPVDHERFPAIRLAWRTIESGGSAGAVLNAANEVAVEAFLAGSIRFGDISQLVSDAMDELPARPVSSLAEVMAADREAREWARERVAERASAAR
jgi:1-deoxy-D-xylulose-5-phosphate reductoisomerase